MPSVQCAVVSCANGTYRLTRWKGRKCKLHGTFHGTAPCDCKPPFELLSFPRESKNATERKIWISQMNRKTLTGKPWIPKPYDRICNKHFVDGKPSSAFPYPTLDLGYVQQKVLKGRRLLVRQKETTKDRISSFHQWKWMPGDGAIGI